MIKTKEDLRFYLSEDKRAQMGDMKMPFFKWAKLYVAKSSELSAYRFLWTLRHYEYYLNTCENRNPLSIFCKYYYGIKYNRISTRLHVEIPANCIGYGCRIHHINVGGIVFSSCKVGNYLDIRQCTTIGVKSNDRIVGPTIGNNVFLGCNVSVIGDVSIGDNVIIGAGAVVLKDIPSNCIAAGNPCKVIKMIE